MDLKKAKLLLDKINALYQSINSDRKNVSSIEKDLMKSYVLQFYESFLDVPHIIDNENHPAIEIIKSSPKPEAPKREEPKPEPAPEPVPPPKPAPVAVVKEEPEKVEDVKPEPVPAPVEVKTPPPPKREIPIEVSEELEELFAFNKSTDLSEKLGEMPITDIKKAMGLNERIFTVNELFGGDQAVFDLTLDTLNKLTDFTQAKSFLVRNAATKYEWASKGRKSKAKNFIKLVKRRYN